MQKQSQHVFSGLLASSVIVALVSISVQAHHGWGGNSGQHSELTGTLETPVSFAGPHATMKIRVDNQVWDITLAPPGRTMRSGLKEGVIPVGATVTVLGHKNMTANRLEMKTERVTWDRRVFNVYPDLH